MTRRALLLLLTLCASFGVAAAAPAFHLSLSQVQFAEAPGLAHLISGTIRNDGVDSLFIQGMLTDIPTDMGGDTASAGFLATAPSALGPGEAWTGEIVTLHLAPDVAHGSYVFSLAVLAGASEFDTPVSGGTNFRIDVGDSTVVTGAESGPVLVERLFTAPNPFRGETGVWLDLRTARNVDVAVFDVTGRRVRRLYRGPAEPGHHRYVWDGADDNGRLVGPGVYVVQVLGGTNRLLRQMVRLR